MPLAPEHLTREHVESFTIELLERYRPATASARYRALKVLFDWLVEERVIRASPMTNMKPPIVPEDPPPVLGEGELRALLATCEHRRTFEERRDYALLRVFVDTGARLSEIGGLRYDPADPEYNDVRLDDGVLTVLGKGRRERVVAVGAKTVRAIDRYLRLRAQRRGAHEPWLWLGRKGRFAVSGISQMVKRRGEQAGIRGLHPHLFRHSMAHHWPAGRTSASYPEGAHRRAAAGRRPAVANRHVDTTLGLRLVPQPHHSVSNARRRATPK